MASDPKNPLAQLNPATKKLMGESLTISTAQRVVALSKVVGHLCEIKPHEHNKNTAKSLQRARVFLAKIAVIAEEYCGCMLDLAGEFNKADSTEIERELL